MLFMSGVTRRNPDHDLSVRTDVDVALPFICCSSALTFVYISLLRWSKVCALPTCTSETIMLRLATSPVWYHANVNAVLTKSINCERYIANTTTLPRA